MEKNEVTLQDAIDHGITKEEFERIIQILGRVPNSTELGIFSGMWSEHCSYKNSILQLKTLPTASQRLVAKPGEENAGALDIGQNLAIVFKIESHNHPTAVEPYQGAATGVGGIMRDIFTMGARPFVSLNSLRFGFPTNQRNKYLLSHAVKGIGDYGNSLGIAVGGGELLFDDSFTKNPLVNAMSVGIAKIDKMAKATTGGAIGNSVYLVGARTGRDGIHGASFASKDLTKESEEKKSAVQVGDPFMEKLLLEASLEVIDKDLIVGIQDMGAAGISCSTSEMSAKGNTGMEIDLDKVPYRETGMNAYEAMLSESQERMLVVPKKGKEKELEEVFHKWDLNAVEIGKVTKDKMLRIKKDGQIKAEIPAESLVLGGGAPRYVRETKRPDYLDLKSVFQFDKIPDVEKNTVSTTLRKLLSSLNVCSRNPLFEQYDTEVGLGKIIPPGGDGGLYRVPDSDMGVSVSTDCNSRYTYLNPYKGAIFAVCESARNVVVTGATPIGITNNLNFGNPFIPENYYMFTESIRGMGDACRFLSLPVTGGNVSFYNESPDGPVLPTPTIGMIGIIDDVRRNISSFFKNAGLNIALIGNFRPSLGGSEYLHAIYGFIEGEIPKISLEDEFNLQKSILELNDHKLIFSAKDISLGGLLTTLCKKSFQEKLGFDVSLKDLPKTKRLDETLFGETSASVIITYEKKSETKIKETLEKNQLNFHKLGVVTQNPSFTIAEIDFQENVNELKTIYDHSLDFVFK